MMTRYRQVGTGRGTPALDDARDRHMKKMEQDYFIKTTDEATANYLRLAGFTERPREDGRWVFLNDGPKVENFSTEGLKMNYSNMLCI